MSNLNVSGTLLNDGTIDASGDLDDYIKTYKYGDYEGGEAILEFHKDLNKFSWQQSILVPGIQAAAQLLIAKYQSGKIEDYWDSKKAGVQVALDNYIRCLNALLPEFKNAFPNVPECAQYIPIDFCQEQVNTILCNLKAAQYADDYIKEVNRQHQQNQLIRAKFVIPLFEENRQFQAIQISDLLQGKLPIDDVGEILTDNAELACLTGRIGNTCKTTFRDLGVSRLRAQALGRQEFANMVQLMNSSVSPVSQLADVQSMMVTPQQRIAFAFQQTLYIWDSTQRCFNNAALKPPAELAALQVKLQKCLTVMQGEMAKTQFDDFYMPNYQQLLNPFISGLSQGIGSAFMGGYSSPYGQAFSGWNSMGMGTSVTPGIAAEGNGANFVQPYSSKGGLY